MVRGRNSRRFSQLRVCTLLTCAVAGVSALAPTLMANNISKAGNSTNLNVGSSWVGGVVPGSTDVAVFDSNMGSFTNFSLGDNLRTWQGILLQNPSVGVTILAGNNLILGSSGIDTTSASVALTLNNNLVLSGTGQSWTVGNGGLTVGGATNLNGGTLNMGGFFASGNTVVTGAMSNGTLLITSGNVTLSGSDNLTQIVASNSSYTTTLSGVRTVGTVGLYGGTVNILSAGAIGGAGLVFGGATFDNLSGSPLTVNGADSLAGGNTVFVGSNNLSLTGNITAQTGLNVASTLTLSAGTTTISGGLTAGNAAQRFTKDGTGLLVFSGTGSLGGGLTVAAGTMTVTGSLTAGGAITQIGASFSTPGVLDINGGTMTSTQGGFPSIRVGALAVAGASGAIRLRNNGMLTMAGQLALGNDPGQYAGFSMTSGSLNITANGLAIGGYNGYGAMTMSGGVGQVATGPLWVAGGGTINSTGAGVVNLTGGTLTETNGDSMELGQFGFGVLNISGSGWFNAAGSITISIGPGSVGQLNLNGGTLTTTLIRSPGTGNTYANFNGGVLAKTNTQTAFLGAVGNLLKNAAIWSGGLIINDGGTTANILQPLSAPTGFGVSSIPLTQSGTGYIDQPVIVISGGGGLGATAIANVDASGNFTSITVTNRGQGYTSAPSVAILGGGSTGANAGTPVLSDNTLLAAGGFTKLGGGTVVLQAQNNYAGATTVNAGSLRLDFATAGVTSNLINPVSALNLNGANLTAVGLSGSTGRSQAFAGTTVGIGGPSGVTIIAANATSPIVVNLGALSHAAGSYIDFNSTWGSQTSTNGIITSNAPGQIGGWGTFLASGTAATWAVIGADPANPGNITGMTSGFSTSLTAAANVDLPAGSYTTGALTINTLRMAANNGGYTLDTSGGLVITSGGLMLTSSDTNSGHSSLIQGGTLGVGAGKDLVVIQNSTVNSLTISAGLNLGTNSLIKTGNGLLDLTGVSSFTGKVFMYGGTLGISDSSDLGANPGAPVANQLTLTGTLRFDASMNAGVNRGVTLGSNSVIDTQGFNATMGAVTTGTNVFNLTKIGTGALTLSGNNAVLGTLVVRGGTLNLTGANTSNIGGQVNIADTANSPAVLVFNNGTLTATANAGTANAASITVGSGGASTGITTGVLMLNGGTLTTGRDIFLAGGPAATADTAMSSYGAIVISNGLLSVPTTIGVGRGTTANGAGTALLQMTGGTIVAGYLNATSPLQIGAFQGVSTRLHGVAVLLGGTLGMAASNFDVGDNTTPGIANFLGTNASAPTFAIGSNNSFGNVLNLNAGNITTGAVTLNTNAILNLNGGTLTARTGSTTLMPNNASGRAYVWTGGAIFDSNGTSSTIAQPLLAPDVNGVGNFGAIVNASASVTSATVTLTGGLPAGGATISATALAIIANGSITGFQITNPGYGYTAAPSVTITSNGGTAATTASISTLQGVSLNLASSNFTGGSGYIAPPVVAILPAVNGTQSGSGTGASAYATVDASGNLTGIVLTNPGVGYTSVTNGTSTFFPTVSILGGGGTGATIGQLSLFNLLSGGGVTKNGAGTLTFSSSANNFTGPTNVNAGTMLVTGTFNGAGAVTVAGGAALTINGRVSGAITVNGGVLNMGAGGQAGSTAAINSGGSLTVAASATITGAVTVAGGGLLDMTGGTPGTLTLPGGLTIGSLAAPTVLKFDLGVGADSIAASNFTITGTNSTPITLNIGNPAPNTTYTLASFSAGTNLTGLVNLTANSTKSGFITIDLQTPNGALTVTTHGKVQPPDAYWTGQYGSSWNSLDVPLTGTNSNFNDSPTINSNANQWPGTASNVVFISTVQPAIQNLSNLLGGDFAVKSVQVKSGVGAVTISNSTSVVNTLTLGLGGLLNESGAGGLTINTNVALSATQTWSSLDSTTLITVNGPISGGSGNALSVVGNVILNGTSTYAGTTFLAGGTVTAGANAALGIGTLSMGASGRLEVNGRLLTIGGLVNTDPTSIIENSGATPGTLTVNTVAGANNAYSGILQDGASNLSLRVTGNGSLTVSSNNTIAGTASVGSGTLILPTTGGLTVTNLITVGDVASTMATLIVNGGTLNANRGATTPAITIGSGTSTKGAVVLNSGVMNFSNESFFGFGPNAADPAATSYGALIINGGTLTHANFIGLSRGQAANSGGTAILQMTGGLIDGSGSPNPLQVGAYQGTAGVLHAVAVLQGGNIVESGAGGWAVGDFVTGVANMLGTNVTASITAMGRSGGAGILNLNAGTLTSRITWNTGSTVNFNGGTLRVPSDNITLVANSAASRAYIFSGGAIIDTNSDNSSIDQSLLSPASLRVAAVNINNGGTGFTSAPTLTLSGGGGTGATATAVVNTTSGAIGTITITNPGIGYTSAPTITVSGPAGSGGFILAASMGATQGLATIAVTNSGSGYLNAPPILDITGGGGTGATAIANVGTSGTIIGITITNPGIGYFSAPTVTVRGGGGTGLALGASTFADIIGGGLTLNGSGTITLSNTVNTYSGNTVINGGKMNLTGGSTGSPTWNLNNATILNVTGTLNAATAINVGSAASMSSTGVITTGTLNTNGLVNAGGTLSASIAINVLTGGTLNANGAVSAPVISVGGGGVLGGAGTITGPVTLAAGTSDATRGTINTIDGVSGTLTLANPLTLGGAGNTSNLKFEIFDRLNLGSNPLVTNAGGATIFLNGSGQEQVGQVYTLMTYNNTVSPILALNSVFMGFDTVSLSISNSSASVTILTVPATPAQAYFSNNRGDGVWNTVVSGQSNWNIDANSNTGVTQLPGANTDVFLVTSNPAVTNFNMTLGQNFQIKSLHALSATGAATLSGNSTLTVGSGGITLDSGQGGLTINANLAMSADQIWANNATNPLTVNGVLSSTGSVSLVKNGTGQLILSGANTFGGSVTLNSGTLTLGNVTALGNGSTSFLFGPSSGSHLQLMGNSVRIGLLSGDSTAVVENGGTAAASLIAGGSIDSTFAGVIQDGGSGSAGLIKAGSGHLTITNSLNYNGPTTVRQGDLVVNGGQITSGTASQFTIGDTAGLDAQLDVVNGVINPNKTAAPSLVIGGTTGTSGVLRILGGTVTTASELHVGGNSVGAAGAYAALDMTGGSLTVGSSLAIGFNNDRSVFNMSGGTLGINANSITVAGGSAATPNAFGVMNVSGGTILANNTSSVSLYVGESGSGVLNVSGNANLALNGALTFARLTAGNGIVNLLGGNVTASAVTMASAGSSVFNFNGGTLVAGSNASSAFMTGLSSAYIWSGSANINDSGMSITIGQSLLAPTGSGVSSITVTGATGFIDTPVVIITGGGGTGATAVANIDTAGHLTGITVTSPGVGYTSNPTVTVTGGGLKAGNSTAGTTVGAITLAPNAGLSGGLNKYGTGTLTLSGASTYVGSTTVNGGVLSISANANLGAAGSLNFNGGTLLTTAAFALDNAGANKRNLVVNGGVTFDTTSSSNTLTVSGNISGSGSLTLIGGKVNVNGTSSVPIYVMGSNNARLGGTGVITAPVTLQDSTEINLLSGNVGTLTLSGGLVTTGSQNVVRFDLGGVQVSSVDRLSISTLTLGSSNVTVSLNNLGVNPGTYTLMSYSNLLSSGGSLTLDSNSQVLGASTATISQTATALLLTVAGAAIPTDAYWSGNQFSSTWSTVGSGAATNFNTSAAGGIDTHQTPGAITNVFFGTTTPPQNSSLFTTLGADFAVRGVTVLSTMTNTVAITGNTLSVGSGGLNMQPGAGTLTVSSNVLLLVDQTWTNANSASTLTVSGVISGNQNLAIAGKISIGGGSPNTFIGNVSINSGKLSLGGAGALGDASNQVNFAPATSATLDVGASAVTTGGLNGGSLATAAVTGTGTLTIAAVGSPNFNGSMSGALSVVVVPSSGTQTLSGSGDYSGATTINAGAVLKNGSATALSPNTSLAGAGILDMGGFNGTVATVAGTLNVRNNGASPATLTIGGNSTTTFTGTFSNGTSTLAVIKNGTGDLILLGQSMANTGGLIINGGQVWPTNNNFNFPIPAEGQVITSLGGAGNTVTLNTGGTIHSLGAGNNGGLLQADWYMPNNFVFAGGTYYHQDGAMPHLGSDGQGNLYSIGFNGTGSVLLSIWNTKTPYIDGYLTGAGSVTLVNAGGGSRAQFIFTNGSTQNTFSGQVNIDTATALGENLYLAGATSMSTFGLATIDTGPGGTSQTFNAVVFVSLSSTVQSPVSTLSGPAPSAVSFGALQGNGFFALANQTNGSLGVTLTVGAKNIATTYSGVMSGIGGLVVVGGTLALTAANTYTGGTTLNGGVLALGNAAAIGTTGTILFGGGTLQHSASNALDLSSRFSTAAGQAFQIDTNGQNITYTTPLTSAGGSISKFGAGTLRVTPTGNYSAVNVNQGTLALASTAGARHTPAVLTQVGSVTVAAGTTLDLSNRDMLIHSGSTSALESKIGTAYFFGLWNKPGITSSTAQTNPITSLGIMSGADYNVFSPTPGTFDGAPVVNTDTVIKFTYVGDLNLDGLVNDDDLFIFNGAYFFGGTGNYALGDLNFDGLVNDDDLFLFNGNYFFPPSTPLGGLGDTSLASAAAAPAGGAAPVPEPASLVLLGMGATALLSRRKNRRRI